jgi:hypothetical protein
LVTNGAVRRGSGCEGGKLHIFLHPPDAIATEETAHFRDFRGQFSQTSLVSRMVDGDDVPRLDGKLLFSQNFTISKSGGPGCGLRNYHSIARRP